MYVIEVGDLLICLKSILFLLKISSISFASAERGGCVATKIVTEYLYLSIAKSVQLDVSRLW